MIIRIIISSFLWVMYQSFVWADIYSYLDELGQTHFVNYPVEGGKLIRRLSPILEDKDAIENVQQLLNAPRFSRAVTMTSDTLAFKGNFPKPRTFDGFGIAKGDPEAAAAAAAALAILDGTARSLPNMKGRDSFAPYITMIARQYNLQPALLHAVITVESAYNPKAKSHAGAVGLMQLMPPAAARFGVTDREDPIQNMQGGAAYLRWLLDHFGDVSLALAGYNAGEGSVRKYGNKIPPFKETQAYVPKVLEYYQKYKAQGY